MKEVVRLIMADYRRGENAAARVWRQAPEQGMTMRWQISVIGGSDI
ncbi:hypothetical protein EDWATA_01285 [Edwardsiella tarda ATCC 23685]|uniref:Uncharacterized protein n=1 Tax=Edwardsiella tarda ATCC 23685 TaxID=500638 RepID=D4F3H5_EDWTA|nr:hypothetical protein EDWATA_01285 [Edwardsiella tarda ATCC 23685]